MLISQDQSILTTLKNLESLGIEVTLCHTGKSAYETFIHNGEGYYSFCMIDIQMSKMNGITIAKKIRNFEQENKANILISIIMLTSVLNAAEKSLCLDKENCINAKFYERKPLNFEECKSVITVVLTQERKINSLIIDDDSFNLVILSRYFELNGLKCKTSKSWSAAIKILDDDLNYYNIFIVNCELKDIDCKNMIKMIREFCSSQGNNKIHIIGIYKNSNKEREYDLKIAGINKIFYRPIDYQLMLNYLKNIY